MLIDSGYAIQFATRFAGPARSKRLLGVVLAASVMWLLPLAAGADADGIPRSPSTEGARVYIISPAEGATVTSPVTVRFGLVGMGVAPAGIQRPGTGHHHLIIDAKEPSGELPVPADADHRHFGGGQTEANIDLEPGQHTLQLVLADYNHVPHDPPIVSEVIHIVVE